MNKLILKDLLKEIKNSLGKFISLLLISFVGVAFFVGIQATPPFMKNSADATYQNSNIADIKIVSSLALQQEDLEALEKIDEVESIELRYEYDLLSDINNQSYVFKVASYQDSYQLNKLRLLEGKLPTLPNQAVLITDKWIKPIVEIGETIKLTNADNSEINDVLNNNEVTVVGIAEHDTVITTANETSTIGSGFVDFYMYMPEENFNLDVYSSAYIKTKNPDNFQSYSTQYEDYIHDVIAEIKPIAKQQELWRQQQLISDATEQLTEAKQTYQENLDKFNNEIETAKTQLQQAQTNLDNAYQDYQKEKTTVYQQLKSAQEQINAGWSNYQKQLELFNLEKANAEAQISELQIIIDSFGGISIEDLLIATGNDNDTAMQLGGSIAFELAQGNITQAEAMSDANYQYYLYVVTSSTIDTITNQLLQAENELANAKVQLEAKQIEIDHNKALADANFKAALQKLQVGQKEITDGYVTLHDKEAEGKAKLMEAQIEIDEANSKINEIEKAKWYILDRDMFLLGYADFGASANQMQTIANIFPLFFILVAILVCLTSMTRMVEENRQALGSMKALGYSRYAIMNKYLLYAFIASFIGSITGCIVGILLFPTVIYNAWLNSASLGPMVANSQLPLMVLASSLLIIVILITTACAAYQSLKETPANLLRPKAPKIGKKILLERISFIWKHFSFSNKITARNIFRYKKRFMMIIVGIAGSTALLVVGFGLLDSLNKIEPTQYQELIRYDATLMIDQKQSDTKEIYKYLDTNSNINNYMLGRSETGSLIINNNENNSDISIIIPDDLNEFSNYNLLLDYQSAQPIDTTIKGVIISENFAKRNNLSVGQRVILRNNDYNEAETTVAAINKNYVYDYLYIDEDYYNELFNTHTLNNTIFVDLINSNPETNYTLFEDLASYDAIINIRNFILEQNMITNVLGSLDLIMLIIIICSALLAFVVLYNLGSVNISERTREIATLKVLGFKEREVRSYINKESYLLSFLGSLVGLLLGYFLHNFIMSSLDHPLILFPKFISPVSYLLAIIITFVFTIIINFIMGFVLKKIDMIESLKSIE